MACNMILFMGRSASFPATGRIIGKLKGTIQQGQMMSYPLLLKKSSGFNPVIPESTTLQMKCMWFMLHVVLDCVPCYAGKWNLVSVFAGAYKPPKCSWLGNQHTCDSFYHYTDNHGHPPKQSQIDVTPSATLESELCPALCDLNTYGWCVSFLLWCSYGFSAMWGEQGSSHESGGG